jgi:MYXO-CTERM domain-containing protein
VLTTAVDINDLGSIVGIGTHNGQTAAFLLTPVPEPSSMALAALAAGALCLRLRRRRLAVTST